jgi:Cupin
MRLEPGAYPELHWHKQAEWAYVLNGGCRICAVDQEGRNFLDDVRQGDLWVFPKRYRTTSKHWTRAGSSSSSSMISAALVEIEPGGLHADRGLPRRLPVMVDPAGVQVISAARSEWIHSFTGLTSALTEKYARPAPLNRRLWTNTGIWQRDTHIGKVLASSWLCASDGGWTPST